MIVIPNGHGRTGYGYEDVDGDKLAMFPAYLPDGRKGVNFRTSFIGCTITADDVEDFIACVRATLTDAQDGESCQTAA